MRLILVVALLSVVSAIPTTVRRARIDPFVIEQLGANGKVDIFVKMNEEADLSQAYSINGNRGDRAKFVFDTLNAVMKRSQASICGSLSAQGVKHQGFWINNAVFVEGVDASLIEEIAQRPDVDYIRGNHNEQLHLPIIVEPAEDTGALEWGVSKIAANKAWAKGHKGQGVVVANIDTGVRYTHEALVGSYRGNKGGSFDHDYSWFDPEQKDKVPTDGNGHGTAIFVVNLIGAGTHTMGTIAGSEASGVGVAPSAKWIAAKGCSTSSCSTFSLTKSAEWVACPTRVDGTNPDCSKVPDVVNNSWGGGGGDNWYEAYIKAWRAAGIIPVFSAGNSGPSCDTLGSPGDSALVISVGATDVNDTLAYFSSKGPGISSEGFREQKPDVSAPGYQVRSAGDNSYVSLSGTSMAAPHVTGAVAIALSAKDFEYDKAFEISTKTAVQSGLGTVSPTSCGGVRFDSFPNYDYGYGRIDVCKMVNALGAAC